MPGPRAAVRLAARSRHLRPLRRLVLDRRGPVGAGRLQRWAASPSRPGAVALVGDSLAAEFPPEYLTPLPVPLMIRGWPGETIAQLRDRVDETLARQPSVLILQTGANDVLRGRGAEAMVREYAALMLTCRDALPDAVMSAVSLPPIAPYRVPVREVRAFNLALSAAVPQYGFRFVDAFTALATDEGAPRPGMSRDGLHLTGQAYAEIGALLRRAGLLPSAG